MKIHLQQLAQYLNKKIVPLYLISGDEILLVQEARDMIRKHAITAEYTGHETFYVETGFNWDTFLRNTNNLSLFDERTLIELHIKSKLTDPGNKILQNYAKAPDSNKIVVIFTGKLDAAQQKTAWFKAVDANGIVVQIWPIDVNQLPLWIAKRLQQLGLKTDNNGIKLLADHAAGNLLAAAQEIEKLHILYGNGNLSAEQIIAVITDSARFNVFDLLDNALAGNTTALIRMLDSLKLEGIEPTIILWAIARELRALINIISSMQQGETIEQALIKNGVWQNRKIITKKALARHTLDDLQNLLKQAALIDYQIKGIKTQNLLWHELSGIYLNLSLSSNNSERSKESS